MVIPHHSTMVVVRDQTNCYRPYFHQPPLVVVVVAAAAFAVDTADIAAAAVVVVVEIAAAVTVFADWKEEDYYFDYCCCDRDSLVAVMMMMTPMMIQRTAGSQCDWSDGGGWNGGDYCCDVAAVAVDFWWATSIWTVPTSCCCWSDETWHCRNSWTDRDY